MSVIIGLLACAVSSILFGSVFVPIKSNSPGNGIFAQWLMSSTILIVGLAVHATQQFPEFEPLAMLGGVFWALGNASAVPIINVIGLGIGLLIWGTTNCVTGWATGRFGLFGTTVNVPRHEWLNYFGLLLVIVGGALFSKVESRSSSSNRMETSPLMANPDSDLNDIPDESRTVAITHRREKRIIAIVASLVAGIMYGVTFVPVIYIQNHPEIYPTAPKNGLGFVFSHFVGIFTTATLLMLIYTIISKNRPYVSSALVGPSLLAGAMWGIAQTSWFIANDNLSQAVSFPIIAMVPGVCAALWSVFYFREIEGARNIRLLTFAIIVTMIGAILVGISK